MILPMNWDIVIRMTVHYSYATYKFLNASLMLSDPGAFLAAKSAEILGQEVLESGKVMEKKESCFIASFGDYHRGKWCPSLILFYRYHYTYYLR